ncbi:MAG TPA: DPP IV N-terminal domain-containing protein [Vicinamibacterales bacterium]|nr:DPP IV N-terminal domain-containing protein [Vicinamibacterales bacterium]
MNTHIRPALALAAGTLLLCAPMAAAQGTRDDYARAERFLNDDIKSIAYDGQVDPHWIAGTDRFWYLKDGPDGKTFLLVDAAQGTRTPAFDHQRLAQALSRAAGAAYTARDLPFSTMRYTPTAIAVTVAHAHYKCDLGSYECAKVADPGDEDEEATRIGPPRQPDPTELPPTERPSPDHKYLAFVRGHNLWVRVAATGEEIQLSHDGEHFFDYATPLPSPTLMVAQGTEDVVQAPAVFWSPDSRRIATYVMDQRNFPRLTITQSAPPDQFRPKYFSYAYPLPVDWVLPTSKLVVFDIARRKQVAVGAKPLVQLYYGGPTVEWFNDSQRFQYREIDRGYTGVRINEVNALTGEARTVVDEKGSADFLIDTSILLTKAIDDGRERIWSSERDGWNHFFLYDTRTGAVKNQITKGDWTVRAIDWVDEKARTLYFSAGGREAGRDPYLRHVYRIGLDGTGLTLLTPENADHAVSFSPDGRYFVDVFSRVDVPAVSVVRSAADGRVVQELEKADVTKLTAMGWKFPEPFKAKAADGKTDLYAVIWRPTNFDPSKKYPVVENIYTGPQGAFVPKTFAAYHNQQQAIAELGFITVFIDGRGTALRSRAFRAFAYHNLGFGAGGDDHITVFKQMAAKYPYMDLTRVGVWGHSAGGYDSTHAILTHPDFYKVAVSSAGCHDNRMDKATWNEQWMGWPVDKNYEEVSNYTLAPKLQGKLFLAHGDVDENVPMPATIKLVDALVKANKDFDFLIMPNRPHGFGNDPYFVRRRWDYFVKNLLHVDPPPYQIGQPRPTTSQGSQEER